MVIINIRMLLGCITVRHLSMYRIKVSQFQYDKDVRTTTTVIRMGRWTRTKTRTTMRRSMRTSSPAARSRLAKQRVAVPMFTLRKLFSLYFSGTFVLVLIIFDHFKLFLCVSPKQGWVTGVVEENQGWFKSATDRLRLSEQPVRLPLHLHLPDLMRVHRRHLHDVDHQGPD